MKTKDKKELHLKSIEELNKMAMEAKDALAGLRLDKTQNQVKNTKIFSLKRKEIAQMLTVMRLKELQREMEEKNEKASK